MRNSKADVILEGLHIRKDDMVSEGSKTGKTGRSDKKIRCPRCNSSDIDEWEKGAFYCNTCHHEFDDRVLEDDIQNAEGDKGGRIQDIDVSIDEDKWITVKGTHVLVDDNGNIKNDNIRKKIEATSSDKKSDKDSTKNSSINSINNTKAGSSERTTEVKKMIRGIDDESYNKSKLTDKELKTATHVLNASDYAMKDFFGDDYDEAVKYATDAVRSQMKIGKASSSAVKSDKLSDSFYDDFKKNTDIYYTSMKKLSDVFSKKLK